MKTLSVLVVLSLSAAVVNAELVWNYRSTGGGTTLSGVLTTTGQPADLAANNSFDLVSIDTVLLNGTDITAPANWSGLGAAPPFSSAVSGAIAWDTVTGIIDTAVEDFVIATDATNLNGVRLATPGTVESLSVFDPTINAHATFTPTSTTITPVPEPNSFLFVAVALLLMSRKTTNEGSGFRSMLRGR